MCGFEFMITLQNIARVDGMLGQLFEISFKGLHGDIKKA